MVVGAVTRWNSHPHGKFRGEAARLLVLLSLGQLVSFCLAVASFTSSILANYGVDTPLTQSFFTYLSLLVVYGCILLYRRQKLLIPWYWYAFLGASDVQGNFLVVKAYQYSSITSVTLLDCWTVPWVMILTWLLLGTRYSLWKLLGAAICLTGLCLVLLSDAQVSDGSNTLVSVGEGKEPVWGDALVIFGTFFFAFSNVGEEICVKKIDRVEVVAMLGTFGLFFSVCEILIFERKALQSVKWSLAIVFLYLGYALSTFVFYSVAPFVLQMSGATLLNLSLLTSDMWAILIRIFYYHQKVDWLYYVAFSMVSIGLLVYSVFENDSYPSTNESEISIPYQSIGNDNTVSDDMMLTVTHEIA